MRENRTPTVTAPERRQKGPPERTWPAITILAARRFASGTLKAFLKVHVPHWRLQINDCILHERDRKYWVALPGKAQIDSNNQIVTDKKTGRIIYIPSISFDDTETLRAFS